MAANPAINLLRIISILSVVLIHTTTKALGFYQNDLFNHPLTLFLNQSTRFAVPLFFLISAFVLELNYPKNFNYFSYLKKRFQRLFLPYLFWSAVYYFFVYTDHSQSFISALLLGDSSYQLYFIPALFIFYLFFPFFHHIFRYLNHKLILLLLIFIEIILLSYDYYYRSLPLPYPLSVFLLNFMPFILGIFACHYQKKIMTLVKKYFKLFLALNIFLSLLITVEGGNLYLKTHNYLSFYSQWRPSVFIYSLSLGAFLFYFFNKIKLNVNLINKIASYSFFVFFVHIIFLELAWKYLSHSFLSFPLILFIIVSILSYFSAFLFSKIKFLSKLTG